MKTSTILALLVAVLIIGGGTWWYLGQSAGMPQNNTATPNNADTNTQTNTSTSTNSGGVSVDVGVDVGTAKTVTVNYSSAGFSPASVTVNKGDTVRFVAAEGTRMWVGADEHPTHTEYDGTSRTEHCTGGASASFDQCAIGGSYSFTFNKSGSFGYHNHTGASHTGTVIVK